MRYKVSRWILDTVSGRLIGPDGEAHLRPQTFRLFQVLVEHAPELLSVDELIDRAWDVEHVSVGTFRQAVSELRQALGDSAAAPQIIATVPRRGYRLMVPVERVPPQDSSVQPADADLETSPKPTCPAPHTVSAPVLALAPTPEDDRSDLVVEPAPIQPFRQRTAAAVGLGAAAILAGFSLWLFVGTHAPGTKTTGAQATLHAQPSPPPELRPQASRLLREAEDLIARLDFETARGKLEAAGEMEPGNPLILDRLSQVYSHLGLDSLAAETARRAARHVSGAPWETARSAEARAAETRGDWTEAAELLQALWQRRPEEREYGLRLARAWIESGRTDAALDLIRRLRRDSGPHPSLDLLELHVLAATNDLDGAEALARRLVSGEDAAVTVPARLRLLTVLLRRGLMGEAERLVDELESADAQTNGLQPAELARSRAFLAERHGPADEGRNLYRRAETLFQVHGDRDALVSVLNRQALFLVQIGDRDEARRLLVRGIDAARRHGLERRLVVSLCLLAQIDATGPNPQQAWEPLREAQALIHGSQEPRRQILWHRSRGDVFLAVGDLDAAELEYEECLSLAERVEDGAGIAYSRLGLSAVHLRRGDLDAAYRNARAAVEVFARLGRTPDLLTARLQVADVEVARGRPRAAQAELVAVFDQATDLSLQVLGARAKDRLERLKNL